MSEIGAASNSQGNSSWSAQPAPGWTAPGSDEVFEVDNREFAKNLVVSQVQGGGTVVSFVLIANGKVYERSWSPDTVPTQDEINHHINETARGMTEILDAGRNLGD